MDLTQMVKTRFIPGLANDAGAEQNAFLEQEITTGYSRKVT